jgi:hypothetical protein
MMSRLGQALLHEVDRGRLRTRKRPLTSANVELRGFEPLTPSMRCLARAGSFAPRCRGGAARMVMPCQPGASRARTTDQSQPAPKLRLVGGLTHDIDQGRRPCEP